MELYSSWIVDFVDNDYGNSSPKETHKKQTNKQKISSPLNSDIKIKKFD